MLDDHDLPTTPARLAAWATTLPPFATDVVAHADLTRPYVYAELPASAEQARVVRGRLTDWAVRLGLPEPRKQDVILAGDEATSNAIEHAYHGQAGTVTLFAACTADGEHVKIIVADRGAWRAPAADPGFRGRGLGMMEKLADVFRLARTERGTTVVLGWPLPG